MLSGGDGLVFDPKKTGASTITTLPYVGLALPHIAIFDELLKLARLRPKRAADEERRKEGRESKNSHMREFIGEARGLLEQKALIEQFSGDMLSDLSQADGFPETHNTAIRGLDEVGGNTDNVV